MAEVPQPGAGGQAIKTKQANARKHLRIGQAAARSKRMSMIPGDSVRERQVSKIFNETCRSRSSYSIKDS